MSTEKTNVIKKRYELLSRFLNERQKRLLSAAEAITYGWGGIVKVSSATGISRPTITAGTKEIKQLTNEGVFSENNRIRREGAGRKKIENINPKIKEALEKLIEPYSWGSPESPLRWTCKSCRNLADELIKQGYKISHMKVSQMLQEMGYSLQANSKSIEAGNQQDRNEQFNYINNRVLSFHKRNQPVIAVDTKKKELIGNFKNNGGEICKKGEPIKVNVYDFIDKNLGKAIPYGVYDIKENVGWVNVGIDHDTAQFAVESIRQWWILMGQEKYLNANTLLITADCGGSNGHRIKSWKIELQKFADEIGKNISVSHFPPGTSKWNKIEHRLFSAISQNWRGKPLISREVVVNLIGATKTHTGLKVKCQLDENVYPVGIKVSDDELSQITIFKHKFHGEWNYTIKSRKWK